MNNFTVKHEVTADFLVEAIQEVLYLAKRHICIDEGVESLEEKFLDFIESTGVGDACSPSFIVNSYLNGSIITCRNVEYADMTDEEWGVWSTENAIFHNDEYACIRF